MSKVIVKVREEDEQSNVYRNKRVIEINHANKTIMFWETKFTFDEIYDFIMEIPELSDMFYETFVPQED